VTMAASRLSGNGPDVLRQGYARGAATRWRLYRGPLAHQAEHLPFKQVVPGSSPGRLTLLLPIIELATYTSPSSSLV
jgi:hypothetical protein